MTADFLTVMAIVAVLSVVQSIFGMGVLIFGTPTLLLLGYDFVSAISILVPASFAISLLQVTTAGKERVAISRHLYLLCLPGIGIGLWVIKGDALGSWINYLIGAVLLVSAALRLWGRSHAWLADAMKKHSPAYHLVMGLTHGLTNLGGALLAILATSQHSEKGAIRYTVAHYYLAFGAIQIILIAALLGEAEALLHNLPMAGIAAAVYLLIGNRLFLRTANPLYHNGLTLFISAYGIAVLLTS
ncbi:MAG: TSUP family transporter [Rhodospirillaceae bacterium]|nr:TSUP family transporter [Rhodospirillaceae bacterium]